MPFRAIIAAIASLCFANTAILAEDDLWSGFYLGANTGVGIFEAPISDPSFELFRTNGGHTITLSEVNGWYSVVKSVITTKLNS